MDKRTRRTYRMVQRRGRKWIVAALAAVAALPSSVPAADLGRHWDGFRSQMQRETLRHSRQLENRVVEFRKRVEDAKLDEKRALVQEFWRIRRSVDFLALMDEEVLEAVTGLDRATVSRISATMRSVASLLAIR